MVVKTLIVTWSVFPGRFLTIFVDNGIEHIAPIMSDGAKSQSIVADEIRKVRTPTTQVNPSAREVIPTALLLLTPESICPPATTGP